MAGLAVLVATAMLLPQHAPTALATSLGLARAFVGTTPGDNATGRAIAVDPLSGKIWSAGEWAGTVDFDPGAGTVGPPSDSGSRDAYLTQLDASGNFVAPLSFQSSTGDEAGRGVAVDASGNTYFLGELTTSMRLFKLNSGGSVVYNLTFDGSGTWFPRGIAVDASGNAFVTGYFSGTVDFDPTGATSNVAAVGTNDMFVIKLSSAGAVLFKKQFGVAGGTTQGRSIALSPVSNLVWVTGAFQGTVSFGGFPATSAGGTDVVVLQLDTLNLTTSRAQAMGGTGADSGASIAVDSAGNAVMTGTFSGTADFDPAPATTFNLLSAGGTDVFVAELNNNGDFVSAARIGGSGDDNAFGIAVDAANNVYIAGSFAGTPNFSTLQNTTTGPTILTTAGGDDAFLLKLDATGAFVLADRFGSTGNDSANAIALDSSGNIYLTGGFVGTNVDFDPGAGTAPLTSNTGDATKSGAFVVKLTQVAPPVNVLPAAQVTLPSTPLVLSTGNNNRISVTDADNGSTKLRVTLSVNSGTLTLATIAGLSFTAGDGIADATMTFSGTLSAINTALDGLTFTPPGGTGSATLQITTRDVDAPAGGQTDSDSLSIAVAQAPVAVNDGPFTANLGATLTVSAANGVLANDTDADTAKAQLAAAVVTGPTRGSLTLRTDGSFDYTPTGSTAGTDSFTYKVTDPQNLVSNTATATITIVLTVAPVAANDSYSTTSGIDISISAADGLLKNDTDADTAKSGLTVTAVTQPTGGTLILQPNGAFIYNSRSSFTGTDSFTYRTSDGINQSNTATVTITVGPANILVVNPSTCGPRPTVVVKTQVSGGALQATVTATETNAPNNRLQSIQFGTLQNAQVTLNGQTVAAGQTVTLPAGTTVQTFTVRRASPGLTTTVPLTVTDTCGAWPSFVGGGAGAGF